MMTRRLHKITMLIIVLVMVAGTVHRVSAQASQSAPGQTPPQPQSAASSVPAPGASPQQAISQTGLLPLFAVDMNIAASWVDGDAFPSTSPQFSHNGVNDVLDQSWATLKTAGFNAIRFPVHLEDRKSAVRVANLCAWANSNGVRLIPVLQGTDALRKNSSDMNAALSSFVSNLITQLRGSAGTALASYAQISFFEIEGPMNHTGLYPGVKPASAQKLLVASSAALRNAETQALQGSGVQGTPIAIAASYDFELVRGGAIAGVPLDPTVEQKAQSSLKEYLNGLSSPNVDAINIEWFPRSISAGDVDHFVTLLQLVKQAFPDREVTLTTGFSTAFNPPDQALQFYAATVSSLGSFRASDGENSKFVGVVLQQAFKGPGADSSAPAGTTDPSQWKWADRSQQLWGMWSKGTSSADMTWWLSKVQDNMGFAALGPDTTSANLTPLPTLQVLQGIASTLAQATQQAQTTIASGTTNPASPAPVAQAAGFTTTPTSGYVPGAQPSTQAASSPFQQMMFTLLQQFTQQMATKLMAKFDGSNLQSGYVNQANAGVISTPGGTITSAAAVPGVAPAGTSPVANTVWIGPTDVSVSASSAIVGQAVVVTAQVHNQSTDQDITGLTAQLVNPTNPSQSTPPIQSGITVPHGGATPVQLSWTPDGTISGDVHLVLQALDSSGQIVTTVAVPQITVQNPAGQNPSSAGNGTAGSSGTNGNSFVDPGSTTNTGNQGTTPTGTMPGSMPTAQLTVAGFNVAKSSASAAGQIPRLQAQISNPSQLPTQSGQAQLFLDGKPQQMQTMGSVLPSGSLILQFVPIQAATGQHNLQLVVTTADGVNATATLVTNVTAVGTGSVSRVGPPTARVVRPIFQSAANLQGTAFAPSGTMASAKLGSGGAQQAPDRSTNVGAVQTTVVTPGVTPVATGSGTTTPSGTASSALSPRAAFVRTITPKTAQAGGQPQSNVSPAAVTTSATNIPPQAPMVSSVGGSGAPASTPQRGAVRTITPTSAQATAGKDGSQTAALLQPPAVRTITPKTSTGPSSSATSPASPLARTATSGVRTITPGMAPTAGGTSAAASSIPGSSTSASAPTRTIVARSSPSGIPPTSNSTLPKLGGVGPASATGVLDLAVTSQDVHVVPLTPHAGQIATFTAVVRNNGTLPAQGATAVFSLMANGQRLASSPPTVFNINSHGAFQARWSTGMPTAGSVQVMVSVVANGDSNAANNQAVASFAVVSSPAKAPVKSH